MKKIISTVICALMITQSAFAAGNTRILSKLDSDYTPDMPYEISMLSLDSTSYEVIVKFVTNPEQSLMTVPRLTGYSHILGNTYLLRFDDEQTAKVVCEYLNTDPNIEYAEMNELISAPEISAENESDDLSSSIALNETTDTPNDYSKYEGEYFLDSINAKEAWAQLATIDGASDRSAVVAVLDSGVDIDNPDLVNRFYRDSNGNIIGDNLFDTTTDSFDDDHTGTYHGTSVSGAIAAEANNDIGICGVAGTFDVKIMPVKIFSGTGSTSTSAVMNGIKYAADNGANVINLSFGTAINLSGLQDAVNYAYDKGVVVVCAAGNSFSNLYQYPACLDNVISVSAIDKNDKKSYFAQFNEFIDITAPGENLALTYPDSALSYVRQGRSGTSFSTPMISSAAALLKIANPYLTPGAIEEILKSTAKDCGREGYDIENGFGKLDLLEAIKKSNTGYVATTGVIVSDRLTLTTNESKQIKVTVNPSNANNTAVTYCSSDTSVATVSNNGVVLGVSPGEAKITVTSNFNNNLKDTCTVTVLPTGLDFQSTPVDLGGNDQAVPDTSSTEFVFSSDKGVTQNSTSYAAALYRIYKNGEKTSVLPKGVNYPYAFAEFLPKNAVSTVAKEKQFTYVLLLDTDTRGIIAGAPADYFTNASAQAQAGVISGWDDTKEFVALATDGSGFNAFSNDNRVHYYHTVDTNPSDGVDDRYELTSKTLNYQVIDAVYNDASDVYAYAVLAKENSGNQVLLTSTYGGASWTLSKRFASDTYPEFKQIIVDGNYAYLLADTSVYYFAMQRTTTGAIATSTAQKLCDIDSSKITKLSLLTNGSSNVLAGYGTNGISAITKDGAITNLYTANGKTISMAFNFNGNYWAMIDNVLHKSTFASAKDYSLDDSLEVFGINLLDSNKNLITNVPSNGKVTVEYYMESKAPIDFEYTVKSSTVTDKYPLQLVTALYNADTNALVDIKRKDLTVDYYNKVVSGETVSLNSILRWQEEFNLDAGTNYKIKVYTFKGHNFYWTEPGNNTITLNVFAQAIEK